MSQELEIELLNAIAALVRALEICGPSAHFTAVNSALKKAEEARNKSELYRNAAVTD